jgi:hypothetical protein
LGKISLYWQEHGTLFALAYWKARRLPISPVPGITAIVRRVKSGAAITPPKTYNYQNPNQPETKTQPRKIQTMMK